MALPQPRHVGESDPLVRPARAPVVPRARHIPDGEVLPIEKLVQPFVARGGCGIIRLCGATGSGKSTALAHLAAVLPAAANVTLLDESESWRLGTASCRGIVVSTTGDIPNRTLSRLELAGWREDEWIEYLLATQPERCASVMARITCDPLRHALAGGPRLWRIVLDAMLADDSIRYIATALRSEIDRAFPGASRLQAGDSCLRRMALPMDIPVGAPDAPPESNKLLASRAIQVILAAERIIELVCEDHPSEMLRVMPGDVVEECAVLARPRPEVVARLHELFRRADSQPGSMPALAASILLAADPDWRPELTSGLRLPAAHLPRVRWAQADFSGSNFSRATLCDADLRRCMLTVAGFAHAGLDGALLGNAVLDRTCFQSADVTRADFSFARGDECDFTEVQARGARFDGVSLPCAQFMGAKLHESSFIRADLRGSNFAAASVDSADFRFADLRHCVLDGLDLRNCALTGAAMAQASFAGCNLEEVELSEPDLSGANFTGSQLTRSTFTRARMRGAKLAQAGIADVRWENADLREADFTAASFHLGSTRCGLVGSTTPCEGSRTGFYTDDLVDLESVPPEEVRKANLRGADLRGAIVEGTDWYLVDLRDAKYSAEQAKHFRECGAIL